jgi:hypothetical protein
MQNRGTHISVQPERAGVPADESNPMVRDYYSATVILYFSKSRAKPLDSHLIKVEKNMLKIFHTQNKKN